MQTRLNKPRGWMEHSVSIGRDLFAALLPDDCVACRKPVHMNADRPTADTTLAAAHRIRRNPPGIRPEPSRHAQPVLCAACETQIAPLLNANYCPRCAQTARPESIFDGRYCAWCRNESHWNIAGIARVGPYDSPLRELLCDLKFGGSLRAADWVSARLADALSRRPWFSRVEVLVPVPMHWLRRLQRPCAHARILADSLGARLHLPVCSWVWRWKYSPSQMNLNSRKQRTENVAGCFGPPLWKLGRIRGRRVCIVDNLVLSAATLHEVSKVLRTLGAAEIYAAIACRIGPTAVFQAKAQAAQRA